MKQPWPVGSAALMTSMSDGPNGEGTTGSDAVAPCSGRSEKRRSHGTTLLPDVVSRLWRDVSDKERNAPRIKSRSNVSGRSNPAHAVALGRDASDTS